MKLVFVLLTVLPAAVYGIFSKGAANSGAMAMIAPFLPPGCKAEIDAWMKESDKVYDWLKNQKCQECPGGVKFNALILKEEIAKKAIDAYLNYLAGEGFDIDKICMQKFRRKELWPLYNQFRDQCIKSTGEVPKHPDLCKAGDNDFPKTSKCVKDKANKIFKQKATPPPMDCLQKGLAKCTKAHMGKWRKHFFVDMKKDPNIHKGLNLWVIGSKFFATKCTGKF